MKRDEIEKIIRLLASSQGFYGRLLASIYNASEEDRDRFWSYLEEQHFNDSVDLVLFLET